MASGTPLLFATSGSACVLLPARVDARWASALLQPQASWPLQLLMIGIITSCFGGRLTESVLSPTWGLLAPLFLSDLTSSHDFNDHFPVLCLLLVCPEPAFPSNQLFLLIPTATSELLSPPPPLLLQLAGPKPRSSFFPAPPPPHLPSSGSTTFPVPLVSLLCSNHLSVILCYHLPFGLPTLCECAGSL